MLPHSEMRNQRKAQNENQDFHGRGTKGNGIKRNLLENKNKRKLMRL